MMCRRFTISHKTNVIRLCGEKGYIGKGIERVMSPYTIMMILVVLFTPVVCWLFSISQKEHRVPLSQFAKEFHEKRYYLHAMGYLVIIRWKAITDLLNEPIKSEVGHWTDLIYAIEENLPNTYKISF